MGKSNTYALKDLDGGIKIAIVKDKNSLILREGGRRKGGKK